MIDQHATPPVLFLIFNRPRETQQAFDAIRRARPPRLYVSADGPRNAAERDLCEQARECVIKSIDWPCELLTRFSDSNLGCKVGVSSAIEWFFQHETEGIVLEDDCVADASFFPYCSNLLERYRHDERVMLISGDNFQGGVARGDGSYYFSRYPHIWGWATWRRAWNAYDVAMPDLSDFLSQAVDFQWYHTESERAFWEKTWRRVASGGIDTWDYQWAYAIFKNGGLCVVPNVNLVSNIGFNATATHIKTNKPGVSALPTEAIGPIRHPSFFHANRTADLLVARLSFGASQPKRHHNNLGAKVLKAIRRIGRRILQ